MEAGFKLNNKERDHYKNLAKDGICSHIDCEHCSIDKMTGNTCNNCSDLAQFILDHEFQGIAQTIFVHGNKNEV